MNPLRSLVLRTRGYARHRALPQAPVIVGGCERSGTTLFLSMLSAHPAVHAVGEETWAFCYGPEAGFDSTETVRMSRLYRCLGEGMISPQATRWAEKTPANVFYFEDILRHFSGEVRLIEVVRDGRDVVTSHHPSRPGEFWMRSKRWIDAVEAGGRLRDDDRVLTVRYEDMVTDTETTFQRVCAHIGERYVPELRDWVSHAGVQRSPHLHTGRIAQVSTGSVRKFERPDFPHRERVEEFLSDPRARDLMDRLGYI